MESSTDPNAVAPVAAVRTRTVAVAALIAVAGLAGLFALGFAPRRSRLEKLDAALAARDERPIVDVAKPTRDAAPADVRLPADLRAMQEATIDARANGYLKRLHADLGDRVTAGQLLAEIDTPEIDAQSRRAQADVALAKAGLVKAGHDLELASATFKRYAGFAEKGGLTPQELDEKRFAEVQAQAALDTAKANVAALEAEVDRLAVLQQFERVTAPFSGTITARDLDVGTLVSPGGAGPGRELFRIARTDVLRVFVDVPQPQSTSVKAGGEALLTVRNFGDREFAGRIVRNAGALDPVTRTLRCQIEVDNREGLLLPGMYGAIRLRIASDRPLVTIPSSAFIFDADGMHVWFVKEGRAHKREVVAGVDFGTTIEVTAGLDGDVDVITNPGERLAENVEVRVAPAAVKADAKGAAAATGAAGESHR